MSIKRMKIMKTVIASAALLAAAGANATATGALGGQFGSFGTLVSGGPQQNDGGTLTGPVTGTIVGGQVLLADQTFADDVVPGESFLAAGPTAGTPATLTFTTGQSYISFLWGSPDLYNTLTVNSTVGGPQV